MYGSLHFQVYEHNLRRLMLLDWLRDEQVRRRFAAGRGMTAERAGAHQDKP